MSSGTLTMYTTTWCGYCHRLKKQLAREGIEIVDSLFGAVQVDTPDESNNVLGNS